MSLLPGFGIFLLLLLLLFLAEARTEEYLLGVGIADVTGPAAGTLMMGYFNLEQISEGIHLRQFSRAFIFADKQTNERVVFVSVDVGMISVNVKKGVVDMLKKFGPSTYTSKNVMISATHTHSGPGGFHQYVLYQAASLGFNKETYNILITGIVKSIELAHSNLKPGKVLLHTGELDDCNINRSNASYLLNPPEERAKYAYDTDHQMVLLKLVDSEGRGIGMVNWFAVHPTSMNNTNKLISSDNKGVTQLLFEKDMNPEAFVGQGKFVAAFANSNLGDVSPNLDGPKCSGTGKPCDNIESSCPDQAQCFAKGPGMNMFDSTRLIGERQYNKAKELYRSSDQDQIRGPVSSRHMYVDMSNQKVKINSTFTAETCAPAVGFSLAAGTTDGPGVFLFKQGATNGNVFWRAVEKFIKNPSGQQFINCHVPKPILLPTGEMNFPYAWQPSKVELQILRIGQFVIIGVPGEFTTMSGRQLREAVQKVLLGNGFPSNTRVVIAGLANDYSSYITTFEEYQLQRYEAASTIYGPHTLQAYIQKYTSIADAMAKGLTLEPGTPPSDLSRRQLSFVTPVLFDKAPDCMEFGDVIEDARSSYQQGERVVVVFVTGHPRNNPQLEGTFLTVEKLVGDQWTVIARDSDWETKYRWKRTNVVAGYSNAHITWCIPLSQEPGTYRLQHFGHRKVPLSDNIESFTGTSSEFQVTVGTLNASYASQISNTGHKIFLANVWRSILVTMIAVLLEN